MFERDSPLKEQELHCLTILKAHLGSGDCGKKPNKLKDGTMFPGFVFETGKQPAK